MPQAEADLAAIRKYYEQVAPDFAQSFVEGAIAKTLQLARFPRLGRTVPEIGDAAENSSIANTGLSTS